MLSITTSSHSKPSGYQLATVSKPVITEPTDVIIQVHAASINPVDVKKADGNMKAVLLDKFPYAIGYDCAGVVTEIGDEVKSIAVGDEVYAELPEASRGSWSEYAKCSEQYIALKPKSLSFAEAASLPLAALTALQSLMKYQNLSGKTVFIPAGLSGTGSIACQLAKNVFHAGKVITTVSTTKVDKVAELLGEGVVDEIIDYTKNDPTKVIPPRSVDLILDTTGEALSFLHLMTPSTGMIISFSTTPSGSQCQKADFWRRPDKPQVPWLAGTFLNLMHMVRQARARRYGVEYDYLFVEPGAEDLRTLTKHIEDSKFVPVVGTKVDLRDFDKVKEACQIVYDGKGGIGKCVIEVIKS